MKLEQEPTPETPEINAEEAREYFDELKIALEEEKAKLEAMAPDDPERPAQEALVAELEEQIGAYQELTE